VSELVFSTRALTNQLPFDYLNLYETASR